ncbi:MAG: helix-turn-helix transcriptional regulator [Desulfatiglandales bacterium]
MEHTNEPLTDIYVMGPAKKKAKALRALHNLGFTEKKELSSWRDAFPPEIRENEGGIYLKVTRERRGLTQTGLSGMTGIPQPHLSEIERGKRPIGKRLARELAKALGVDYRAFL